MTGRTRPWAAGILIAACSAWAHGAADRVGELMALVESHQPIERHVPNKWSAVVRSAFLFAGAQQVFSADSAVVRDWASRAGEGGAGNLEAEQFVRAAGGEIPGAPAALVAEARRFVALLEERNQFIHLDELADRSYRLAAPPPFADVPLLSQETYELGALKNLAGAAVARLAIAADAKNPDRARAALAAGLELGRAACGRPMALGLISGQGIQNRVRLGAMRLARDGRLDASTCRALLSESRTRGLPRARLFLEMERIIGLDSIDRYFARREQEAKAAAEANPGVVTPTDDIGREEAIGAYDDLMRRAGEWLDAQLLGAGNAGEAKGLEPLEARLPEGRVDTGGFLASLRPPAWALLLSEREWRCVRAGMIAAMLLELHRASAGEYPASAGEGAWPEGETWPDDPMSPGRALGYRREGAGYVLWSVGADGVDDGGVNGSTRRMGPLSAGGTGDYLITGE